MNLMNTNTFTMKYFWIVLLLVVVSGCTKEEALEPGQVILAKVGDEVITAEEFLLNYEFGHAHLRLGENSRRSYLNYMIYEALLAQEAEEIRLDTLPSIQHAMHTLREELLIERVFDEKVLANIEVTEEEIRDEINKMAVNFQFRFMPATSRQDADRLYEDMVALGYEAVLEDRKENIPELSAIESQLTSPYVKADEIDGELLVILQDLELNTPSRPAFYQGAWYIFEVTDVRRTRLAPEDYEQKSSTYEKVIYNRKAMEQGGMFVAETMEPLGVRTKREGFDVLDEVLWEWYQDDAPARNLFYYIDDLQLEKAYIDRLVEHYDLPLVEFDNTLWTVKDFVEHFTPGRYIMSIKERPAFRARVADVVALVVRDHIFLQMADEENLGEHAGHKRDLHKWKMSWMSMEYKNWLRKDTTRVWSPEAFVAQAEKLMDTYDVDVRWDVLDTLNVSVPEGKPGPTVHLLKSNSNKQPFPIVAPDWRTMQ